VIPLARCVLLLATSASGALLGPDALPEGEALPPPTAAQLARGEWLMHDFCLACHVLETENASNPFRPKIRMETFGTPERAYANIGRISQIRRCRTPSAAATTTGARSPTSSARWLTRTWSRRGRSPHPTQRSPRPWPSPARSSFAPAGGASDRRPPPPPAARGAA